MKTIAQFVKDRITSLPDLQDALQEEWGLNLGGRALGHNGCAL
jgi:hypothetical protein